MYDDPHRMTFKRGGGCLMLFGLPFFLAGLAIIIAAVTGKMVDEAGASPPLFFIIPFGLVFASVGAGLMFGRAGLTIDLSARTITRWWGLMVPFKSTTYPLAEASVVAIAREVRRSGKSSYTVYPVRIKGFEKPIDIEEPRDYVAARRRAEKVAKFLDLGVEDNTTGKRVVREAGTLDESLRERLRRTGRQLEMPEAPPGTKSKVAVSAGEATFDIPPPGFRIAEYVMGGFGAVMLVGVVIGGVVMSSAGKGLPIGIVIGFGVVGLIFGAALVHAAIKSATSRQLVTISPRVLRLESRSRFGSRTSEIPTDELEELQLGRGEDDRMPSSGKVIVARSDRATLEIGRGLERRELEWVKDVVEFIVTA